MSAAPAPSPSRALAEQQLAMLTRLAEIGMEIAEEARAAPDPALAFARVARAVRLTIALQTRVMGDLEGLDRRAAVRRRERVHREVERVLEDAFDDDAVVDRLSDEAREHLGDAEDDPDFAALSFDAAVARICAALGLETPSPLGETAAAKQTDEAAVQQAIDLSIRAGPFNRNDDGAAPSSDRAPRPPSPRGEKAEYAPP